MRKILKSFPVIVLLTLLIQIFGLLRSVYLSKDLGASFELDAFYLSNIFTISIFSIVTSAISTVLIPNMVNDKKDSKNNSNLNYTIIIMLFTILFSAVMMLLLYLFNSNINSNFSEDIQNRFLVMTAFLIISQFFRIVSTFIMSNLQIKGKYILSRLPNLLPAIVPVMYIFFVGKVQIVHFVIVLSLSYIGEMFIYFLFDKSKGLEKIYLPSIADIKNDEKAIKMIKNTLPILAGSAIFQIQIIITNYLAGFFGQGLITILSNTNQIVGIFQGLLIANIFTLVYPQIVQNLNDDLKSGLKKTEEFISITNIIVILLVWGYAAVGKDLVSLLFYRGNFTSANANMVYSFGMVLMLGLPFSVMRDFFYRIYYARDNTAIPTKNAFITVFINIFLLLVLRLFIGEYSLVVSTTLGTMVSLINISIRMRKDKLIINWKNIILWFVVTNIMGLVMFTSINWFGVSTNSFLYNLLVNISIGLGILGLFVCILLILFKKKITIK